MGYISVRNAHKEFMKDGEPLTILEDINLDIERGEFICLLGPSGSGKSTLLNKLLNQKIAITSDKVGTTRNTIYGIYNDEDSQIVFVDTPGINKATSKLGEVLNNKAYSSFDNDLVLFLVDIASGFGPNDNRILNRLKEDNKDVILVLTKVDKIKKEKLYDEIIKLKDLYNFLDIVPISSIKGINTTELIEVIKKYLKDDVKYFDDDVITNVSEKFLVGEIIREKILILTKEEVPHAVTCIVENMEFKKDKCYINACIVVDRDNLKGIIIGKNGQMLKKVGTMAREEIEVLLGKKVYLELFVKVIENWRQKPNLFEELGISEEDD